MIKFNNNEKRWLEIMFYTLCRYIFSINQKQEDIINFIKGYQWTNLFNYDILKKTVIEDKILLNPELVPSKHEFIVAMNHPQCRLRIDTAALKVLVENTELSFRKRDLFKAEMKEEVAPIEIFPKLNIPNIHNTIYSFLLATRHMADIFKRIKF